MGTNITGSIPFTAWEQAVFVVLFVVFVIALLAALLSWFSKTQRAWQDFIARQNEEWRKWIDRSDNMTADALTKITATLEKLGDKLDAHDDKVDQRIDAVAKAAKRDRRNPTQ